MDKEDPVFQEFIGYWRLSEEMIAKASKDGNARSSRCARSWPATLGVGSPFRLTGLATGQPPAPAARHGRGRGGPFHRPGAVMRRRRPTGSANAGACIS
jgi:hypothetical protein